MVKFLKILKAVTVLTLSFTVMNLSFAKPQLEFTEVVISKVVAKYVKSLRTHDRYYTQVEKMWKKARGQWSYPKVSWSGHKLIIDTPEKSYDFKILVPTNRSVFIIEGVEFKKSDILQPFKMKSMIQKIMAQKNAPKITLGDRVLGLFFDKAYAEPITIAVVSIVLTIGISLLGLLIFLIATTLFIALGVYFHKHYDRLGD